MQEVFIINQNLIDDFVDKINGKEEKNNKVTSISSESTDIEYPSAKAVYDRFDALNEGQIDIATAPYHQLGGSTSSHLADLLHKIDNNFGDTLFCSVAVSGTADAFVVSQTGGLANVTSNHPFFLLAYNNVADSNGGATIAINNNNAISPATIVNTRMGNSAPCAWKKGEWGIFFVYDGRAQLLGSFSDTEYYQGVEFIKSTNTQSSDTSLTGVTNKLNDVKDGTILFYQLPDLKFTATSPTIMLTLRNNVIKGGTLKENNDYKFLNQLSPNSILILQYSYLNNSSTYNIIGTIESSKYTDEKDLKLSYILDTIFSNRVFVVDEVKEESKRVQYFFDAEGDSYATNEILYIYVPRYEVTTDATVTLAWRKINGMPPGYSILDSSTGTRLSGSDLSGYWLKIQYQVNKWVLLDKTLSPVEATTDHAGLLSTADKTKLNSFDEKEDKTNKVTSISSSNTNTQYPSAKATYDAINDVDEKYDPLYHTVTTFDIDDVSYDDWTLNGATKSGKQIIIASSSQIPVYNPNTSDNYSIILNITPNKNLYFMEVGSLSTSNVIGANQTKSIIISRKNNVTSMVIDDVIYDWDRIAFMSQTPCRVTYTIDVTSFEGMVPDLYGLVNNIPSKTSDLTNDSGFLTSHQSLTDYIQKSATSGLLKNDGTVDTSNYLTSHQDISSKEDVNNKVSIINENSTDSQYPTAKAVFNYLGEMVEYGMDNDNDW